MTNSHQILAENIEQLHVSTEFSMMCKMNGFKTLGEIVKHPVSELTNMPEFGMRMLKELITLLKGYGIDELLKD